MKRYIKRLPIITRISLLSKKAVKPVDYIFTFYISLSTYRRAVVILILALVLLISALLTDYANTGNGDLAPRLLSDLMQVIIMLVLGGDGPSSEVIRDIGP